MAVVVVFFIDRRLNLCAVHDVELHIERNEKREKKKNSRLIYSSKAEPNRIVNVIHSLWPLSIRVCLCAHKTHIRLQSKIKSKPERLSPFPNRDGLFTRLHHMVLASNIWNACPSAERLQIIEKKNLILKIVGTISIKYHTLCNFLFGTDKQAHKILTSRH